MPGCSATPWSGNAGAAFRQDHGRAKPDRQSCVTLPLRRPMGPGLHAVRLPSRPRRACAGGLLGGVLALLAACSNVSDLMNRGAVAGAPPQPGATIGAGTV